MKTKKKWRRRKSLLRPLVQFKNALVWNINQRFLYFVKCVDCKLYFLLSRIKIFQWQVKKKQEEEEEKLIQIFYQYWNEWSRKVWKWRIIVKLKIVTYEIETYIELSGLFSN